MNSLVFFLYGASSLKKIMEENYTCESGDITIRQFPDDETYIKFNSDVKGRSIIIVSTLDRPNQKLLPLLFAAQTAKELGAKRVGLIAPYLAYMRQDKRFSEGEGITSSYFANLLSRYFDWMITVDPHLHRRHSLDEIYSIPTYVLHATHPISAWIKINCHSPLLIGPDKESEQWVNEIAKNVNAPYVILEKVRKGDHEVEISLPNISEYQDYIPILIDDVISTGRTLSEAIKKLNEVNMKSSICIGVHAVFANDAYAYLLKSGTSKIITCNTIEHSTNEIDLGQLIIKCLNENKLAE